METLEGVIEYVKYRSKDTGWSILLVKPHRRNCLVTMTGNMPDVNEGTGIVTTGKWTTNPKYGKQFEVESYEETLPSDERGIIKYLTESDIPGLGPATAKAIVKKFGLKTFDILDNHPERLEKVPRLGKKRRQQIIESWTKRKSLRDAMTFLYGLGISRATATKICEKYENGTICSVKSNPYCLVDEFSGIGFKTADSIALNLGYDIEGQYRLSSGMIYQLKELAKQGHVYASIEQLIKSSAKLLGVNATLLPPVLREMVDSEMVYFEDDAIYLPTYYKAEKESAALLREIMNNKREKSVRRRKFTTSIEYDEVQLQAIDTALQSKVMVLTGGPGTGKTTTVKGIISAFEKQGMKIMLAAPTGRAAKRMSESTGREAKTIHRLLEYNPSDSFARNKYHPLEGDVLIVDECSMIDIQLFHSLLLAIPPHMRVILVGDIDQLPSVGAGNVLRDVIDSAEVPVVRLTRIFRQAQTSRIITNAHAVNKGEMPNISNGCDSDFFFINAASDDQIAASIIELIKTRLPKKYGYSFKDIQLLAPMKAGCVGVETLNCELQKALNPKGESIKRHDKVYRVGDKVMQIHNNYGKNVFNGDIGYIIKIDSEESVVRVKFDTTEVDYEYSDLDELVLAYAITIHKSQGSEFPIVVIPITNSHHIMLQRNLIYTGITRAKKVCVLIGNPQALQYAVRNNTVSHRNSKLKERIQELA